MADRSTAPEGNEQGFALVEVLVAAALLLIATVGLLSLVNAAASTTSRTRTREAGTTLQREIVEAARAVPYEQMTPQTLASLVSRRPGLSDSSVGSAGWTVSRRDATYTLSVGVCSVDDPRDGTGNHEAGTFCRPGTVTATAQCGQLLGPGANRPGAPPPSADPADCGIDSDLDGTADGLVQTTATTCSGAGCGSRVDDTPADYKRIVSLVRWRDGGWNLQATTVNSPGSSAAPSVLTLTPATGDPVKPVMTSGTTFGFNATVSQRPATMGLLVGGRQVAAFSLVSGTTWNATWDLGAVTSGNGARPAATEVLDGSYVVSAKAFDQYGQFGGTRSVTVLVNRRRPFAPARVEAGRNGVGVEVEWSPARERDLEGYRVYRTGSGPRVEVCPLQRTTRCVDATPPAAAKLQYEVVGVDRDPAGAYREGDSAASGDVTQTNSPPPAPRSLSASIADGNVVLSWLAPATGDPDPGDAIDHYNVYRDGTTLADRVDRTDVAQTTWTDVGSGGVQHTYWITAVDTQLAESPLLGPVTR